ncbi:T9SS type A sorting domain-containing protein [Hymenobacter sp. UV11]|uniref:SBBP repeat-containing protein n=1 Tax=Hymenobacter sp. UV11 TaxID=1849735 RepID=UPI001061B7A6|nr:SBBP repeat-containing protein [Hymenobacter sp. UV11]TDN38441.1 hypothetical protein A8B98_24105 [Hymenobacter sp. UV11]TFZ67958.1 T9SS type A sorting domain-containing protein [Hymenobacter sp. UV11]
MKTLFTRALLPAAGFLLVASSAVGQPASPPAVISETVRQEWVNNYSSGYGNALKALKVATDAAGNSYTLGQAKFGKYYSSYFLVIKYSPAGKQLWQVIYNAGTYNGSTPTDLAVDAAGNVYVTGSSDYITFFGNQNVDYTTVKYSPAGDRVWESRYDAPQSTSQAPIYDYAKAVAVDAEGNVYVTGISGNDYATVKYNAAGQQVWASRLAGGSAADVAVDLAGNVLVTGTQADDYATVKYSASGQQLWVARYNGPTNGPDEAKVVAVDAAGNVVVTGSSATDYATVSYAPDGQQQWAMRYNGPGNDYDAPQDMAVDAAGNAYVTGTSVGVGTGADYATLKYSRTGQLQWAARYNGGSNSGDYANAIALDPAGNAYVTGVASNAMVTIKYGADGQQRWLISYNDIDKQYNVPSPASGTAIALDKAGNVFVTGDANSTYGLTSIATLKYVQEGPTPPASCNPLATEPHTQPDQLTTAAGTALTFNSAVLVANDTDPLGRQLQVASIEKPSVGTVTRNADGTFTYAPPAGFVGQVDLTYLVQGAEPVLASRATGHYYEFVAAPGICWTAAKTAAAGRTYQGMQGYLATITFQGEQDFLTGRQSSQFWLGASDMDVEGEWRWKTGPEAGQLIWQGDGATGRGLAYTNWVTGQPDDYKNQYRPQGEDYGMLYGQSGQWNDLDECGTGAGIAGYIIEYGGLEKCLPTLYSLGKITLTVGSSSSALTAKVASAAAGQTQSLLAYPNPSNGQFQVRVAAQVDGPAQLELFDLQGKKVKSLFEGQLGAGEVREISVNNQGLATGLYQMRLVNGSNVQLLRVSIQ